MTADSAPIVVENISKRFGRLQVLNGVSMTVERGAIFALLGPNGAGKSTLIDILCTIRQPDSGTARIEGIDVMRNPLKVRHKIGVVFQEPTLDTRLTVRENLEFHGLVYQMGRADRRRGIDRVLDLLQLSDRADALVRGLSAGMRRRLEIGRALLHRPPVLFFDEPSVGLDAQTRAKLWEHLTELRDTTDLTVVVTTHYIDEVSNCDHVCVIDKGEILADDTPSALKARYGRGTLRLTPADAQTADALTRRFPEAMAGSEGQIIVPMNTPGEMAPLLAEFGEKLHHIELEQPSLESVFLTLTGRDIREAPQAQGPQGGRRG